MVPRPYPAILEEALKETRAEKKRGDATAGSRPITSLPTGNARGGKEKRWRVHVHSGMKAGWGKSDNEQSHPWLWADRLGGDTDF